MLLTDNGILQARIADAANHVTKLYWAQVEGSPTPESLEPLRTGVWLGRLSPTQPAHAAIIGEPRKLWPRDPPIRYRARIPDVMELSLQYTKARTGRWRRMTAKIGFPTLRLIRAAIGKVSVEGLMPGTWARESRRMLLGPVRIH